MTWWSPFQKERHARLSLHAWRPETIPVVGWTSLAHLCFPWPVHSAFRAAPASLRYPGCSQTWKGDSDAEVSAKPRSCLATPPEVTTVVAEERRTRSCGLWCRRREDAPAREVKARRESGAALPRRRRRPEWAGGQSPRKRRRGQNGCGSLAWVSDEPWDPAGPGWARPGAPIGIQRAPLGKRHPTRSLPLASGCTRQVCGRARPGLGVCDPQTSRGKVNGKALLPQL